MRGDQLSEVFELVQIRGQMSGGFAARGRWIAREPRIQTPLKIVAMVRGHGLLRVDGAARQLALAPGDLAILNHRSSLELEGGVGRPGPRQVVAPEANRRANQLVSADDDSDVVVGGHVDLDDAGRALLAQALPPVGHVRAAAAAATNVCAIIGRLIDEVVDPRMGSRLAIRHYGQLLLLEVLRAFIGQAKLPPGWLRAITDERLRPAVSQMHDHPEKPWRLDQLARAAGMSRSTFAERFREVAGIPPVAYLHGLRMLRARRALRDREVRVGELAAELGYASESAFSTAFKRETGETPLRYRHRHQT